MHGFRYKHGDRPLEGYTIQRAAGRGGFGEVYYALSDSGREVALKVIQGYEQIELRGVGQCMNLKSPHLVTIFDVKHNQEGVPFVIMEFVAGPSLRQLLDECPGGLGTQKAAFFLREIGKGLQYLHDCGIVHRDLKPGNIFYENGYVKIGDYGLSKAIAASQHSGQTMTVGTVHYMAPEISMGRYDRAIDIYALGAILFEMLTGQVPYIGASPGEILMKHMTAEPDVSQIEEPFATVIRKAMARDPAQRYQSVQEMVEAVFGAEHVQQSVSCFSPDSLTMVAERVARRVAVGGGSATPPPLPGQALMTEASSLPPGKWAGRVGQRMGAFARRVGRLGEDLGLKAAGTVPLPGAAQHHALPCPDSLGARQRYLLAWVVLVVVSACIAAFGHGSWGGGGSGVLLGLCGVCGAVLGLQIARRRVLPQFAQEGAGIQRLALGGLAGVFMFLASLPVLVSVPAETGPKMVWTGLGAAVPLFLMNWARVMSSGRPERLSFGHALGAGLLAVVAAGILGGSPVVAMGIAAGASLTIQVLSVWEGAGARAGAATALAPTSQEAAHWPQTAAQHPAEVPAVQGGSGAAARIIREVPFWVRLMWLVGLAVATASGIALLVVAGSSNIAPDEFAITVAGGLALLLLALLCLRRGLRRDFHGWWRYLVRPAIQWACVSGVLTAGLVIGNARLDTSEFAIGVFLVVLLAIVLLVVSVVQVPEARCANQFPGPGSPRSPLQAGPGLGAPGIGMEGAAQTAAASDATGLQASGPPALPAAGGPVQGPGPRGVSLSVLPARAAAGLVAGLGWVIFLLSLGIGLVTAADLPGFVGAGLPEPQLAEQMARRAAEMNIGDWVGFFRRLLIVAAGAGMLLALVLFLISRRRDGAAHMLRAVVGVSALVSALVWLNRALAGHWRSVADAAGRPSLPASIAEFLNGADRAAMQLSIALLVLALIVLFWPARRLPASPASP